MTRYDCSIDACYGFNLPGVLHACKLYYLSIHALHLASSLRNVTLRQGLRVHLSARTPCPSGVRLTANASQKQKDASETLASVEGGPG